MSWKAATSPALLAQWRDTLAETRAPASVRAYLSVFSHVFTVTVKEWGWLRDNPMNNVKMPRIPRGRVRYLSLASLYPQLGSGELESFALAQTHHLICLTNDRQAKIVAQALGLSYLDLEEILRAFKTRKLLTTATLTALIAQREEHDRTHIKAKVQLLSD